MSSIDNPTLSEERIQELLLFVKLLNINSSHPNFQNLNNLQGLQIIHEALTHSSAQCSINYEKLEFLGDAVLRLAASEFIENSFPHLKVGERSELRSQLVSDSWLTKLGQKIKIHQQLIIGSKATGDKTARSTIEAEATEALIGALYECLKDIEPIHNWLKPYWKETSFHVLSDPHRKNYKSALQEWSQGKGLNLPEYVIEEKSLSHGNLCRFFCKVKIKDKVLGKGWGGSIRAAEKEAARTALINLANE